MIKEQWHICGLTKRAPDGWDSARFLSIFLALSFFRFDGESCPSHLPLSLTVIRHVNGNCRTFPVKNERK